MVEYNEAHQDDVYGHSIDDADCGVSHGRVEGGPEELGYVSTRLDCKRKIAVYECMPK